MNKKLLNKNLFDDIFINLLFADISYKTPDHILDILNNLNKKKEINKDDSNDDLYNDYNIIKPYLDKYIFINKIETDTQLYIWILHDILYISIRGTNSARDCFIDSQIKQTKLKNNIYIHSGFYKQYKSIELDITNYINKNIDNIKAINISGHSLGGAVATVASAILAEKYINIEFSCYTYGSPRVGNNDFKNYFKNNVKKYYRIMMHDDPIPLYPVNIYYNHVCSSIYIRNTIDYAFIKDKKWYMRIFDFMTNINYFDIFANHHIIIYKNTVKNILYLLKN